MTRNRIKGLLCALVALVFSAGCATVAYEKLSSIRGSDVSAADPDFDAKAYQGKKPGQQQRIARTFAGQPPLIPHALDNFDEITLEENQCIECHGLAKYKEKNAPKMGDSHFTGNAVAMSRWQCNSCHVPQVDAPPLVGQNFVGQVSKP